MANLTLTIGSVTATKSAPNAMASALIEDYIAASGGPISGTPQEKADWFMAHLVSIVRTHANDYRKRVMAEESAAQSDLNNRKWD